VSQLQVKNDLVEFIDQYPTSSAEDIGSDLHNGYRYFMYEDHYLGTPDEYNNGGKLYLHPPLEAKEPYEIIEGSGGGGGGGGITPTSTSNEEKYDLYYP